MNTIANCDEIKYLLIPVTQEINKSSLSEFIYTSLESNNVDYSADDYIFINYLKQSKQYQVFVSNKKFKHLIIEIFRVYYFDKKHIESSDLFICNNFIVIYKNSKFCYFQKIDYKLDADELIKFIEKKQKLKIDNIYKINNEQLEKLKIDFLKKYKNSELININEKTNISFKIYTFYLLFIFIFTGIYYFNTTNDLSHIKQSQNKTLEDFRRQKEELSYITFENKFDFIITNLKKYDLKLHSINYKKEKLKLIFSSKIKENIYLFLELYKRKLVSSSILFDEKEKDYECTANVKINR